jgi:hypothetical protein
VWSHYNIFTKSLRHYLEEEQVIVEFSTNDDDDDGYPDAGGIAYLTQTWPSLKKALKHTGACRVGIAGHKVTVTLDGHELRDEQYNGIMEKADG